MNKAQSSEKTQRLDIKIEEAIRKVYGYGEEGEEVMDHFMYTLDDAESYFGGLEDGETRYETMYSDDFSYRNEKD